MLQRCRIRRERSQFIIAVKSGLQFAGDPVYLSGTHLEKRFELCGITRLKIIQNKRIIRHQDQRRTFRNRFFDHGDPLLRLPVMTGKNNPITARDLRHFRMNGITTPDKFIALPLLSRRLQGVHHVADVFHAGFRIIRIMSGQIIDRLLTDDPEIFRRRVAESMQESVHIVVKSGIPADQFSESVGFRGGTGLPVPHSGDFKPFPERRVFFVYRRC